MIMNLRIEAMNHQNYEYPPAKRTGGLGVMRRVLLGIVVGTSSLGGVLGMLSMSARANVSVRNGNFFTGFNDARFEGALPLMWTRVVNSKSSFKGMMGWGWGSEYEMSIRELPDNSLLVNEFGSGADNRFVPYKLDSEALSKAVEMIASHRAASSGMSASAYREKLRADATFRADEWDRVRTDKSMSLPRMAVGGQFRSEKFSHQFITITEDGYVRKYDNGKSERFQRIGDTGYLVQISDKNGNSRKISRGPDGRMKEISDNLNRKIIINWNHRNLISGLDLTGGKHVTYSYNDRDELVRSNDADHHIYSYKYDSKGRHNLVEIGYPDHTSVKITYEGLDQHENVKSVTERSGTVTTYTYKKGSRGPGHQVVEIAILEKGAKKPVVSHQEYFTENKADGEEWLKRSIVEFNGERIETTYSEAFPNPEIIVHNGKKTSFEYDQKGRVTLKRGPEVTAKVSWNDAVGKVKRIEREANQGGVSSWSEYKYDESTGNLVFAKNSAGREIDLIYDSHGNLHDLVDRKTKQRVSFKMDELARPSEITDPSLGTIHVAYGNDGKIKSTKTLLESGVERSIALASDKNERDQKRKEAEYQVSQQILSSFQGLMEMVEPAGVTLDSQSELMPTQA